MANITYTYEYVWYKSRYCPDKPFRMRKCYLPDSSYVPVKDESETITYTVEEAKAEVDKVLKDASPNFILGADCTVPGDTDWEKLRAVIDYAHTWRQTHK